MANLGTLTLDLIARIGGFTGPLDQAARQSRKTADEMSKNFGKLKGVFMDIFPAAAAAASIAGITAFVKSSIDAADHMNDLSKSTGVSVETLSTMGYAAQQSGLDLESLANGFKKLNKTMFEAASGTGEAKAAFDLLKMSVKNNDGSLKSSEQVMLELADKFAGMEDGAGKTALAMKFFGKSGADLIPMLNEGAAGVSKLQQEARDAGIALSTEAAEAADKFNDNLSKLAANIKGTVKPAIGWLVDAFNRMYETPAGEQLYTAEKRLEFLREELERFQSIDPKKFPFWAPEGSYERRNIISQRLEDIKAAKKAVEAEQKEVARLENLLSPKPDKNKNPGTDLNEEAKRREEANDKLVASLKEQAVTFGMAEKEANLYKLAVAGATETQMKAAAQYLDIKAVQDANKKAWEEGDKAAEAIDKQLNAWIQQGAVFGMTKEEAELYKFSLQEGVTPAQIELARGILATHAAQEKQNKATEEGKKLFEETRTPMEAVTAEFERLNGLYEQGAISAETFTRAAQGAVDAYGEKIKKTSDEGKGKLDELKDAIEGWGRSSADAFADFAMSGKASFTDLANSIIQDILRMVAYQQIFKPMFGAISSGVSSLFGSPAPVASAHGNVFEGGNVIPFANGGVINGPVTFPMKTGRGLAGEAGPEGIFPLTRIGADLGVKADLSGMGGPREMKIEIINKSGQPMEVTDAKFNFQDAVVSVWVDAYDRNKGGLRTRMGG